MAEKTQTTQPVAPAPQQGPDGKVKVLRTNPKVATERLFELAEIRQNCFFFRAPRAFTIEDLLKRECWSQVAAKLRVGTKIIAMREDGEFYVELIVFGVGINWAQAHILTGPINGSASIARSTASDDFQIRYEGLIQEWVIVRKSDGAYVKNDGTLKTQVAAEAWLREYLNTLSKGLVA